MDEIQRAELRRLRKDFADERKQMEASRFTPGRQKCFVEKFRYAGKGDKTMAVFEIHGADKETNSLCNEDSSFTIMNQTGRKMLMRFMKDLGFDENIHPDELDEQAKKIIGKVFFADVSYNDKDGREYANFNRIQLLGEAASKESDPLSDALNKPDSTDPAPF